MCLAGIGEDGVLSTTVTYVPFRKRQDTRLYVGGLILPQGEHVRWRHVQLRIGDEVRLKVVEARTVDRPRARFQRDVAAEAEAEKRQMRALAKKLGWKIQEGRKRR